MFTFNTAADLALAKLQDGVQVSISTPVTLTGVVYASGPGIVLASGNVARINFDLVEMVLGRQITPIMVGSDIAKYERVSGVWQVEDPQTSSNPISMTYLNGYLYAPNNPDSTLGPYKITGWTEVTSVDLEVSTTDVNGTPTIVPYTRYDGIRTELSDLEQRVSTLENPI